MENFLHDFLNDYINMKQSLKCCLKCQRSFNLNKKVQILFVCACSTSQAVACNVESLSCLLFSAWPNYSFVVAICCMVNGWSRILRIQILCTRNTRVAHARSLQRKVVYGTVECRSRDCYFSAILVLVGVAEPIVTHTETLTHTTCTAQDLGSSQGGNVITRQ